MAKTAKMRHSDSTRTISSIKQEAEPAAMDDNATAAAAAARVMEDEEKQAEQQEARAPEPMEPSSQENAAPEIKEPAPEQSTPEQPALEQPETGKTPRRRSSFIGAGFLAGIAGGALAFAGATMLQRTDLLPAFFSEMGEKVGLSSDNTALKNELATLKAQFAEYAVASKGAISSAAGQAALTDIQKNTARTVAIADEAQKQASSAQETLKTIRAELADKPWKNDIADLQPPLVKRLDLLETKLGEMEKLKQDFATAQTVILRQQDEAVRLKEDVAAVTAVDRKANANMSALVAASALKAAVDRGGSYSNELHLFETVAPKGISLDLLRVSAEKGLPSSAMLSNRFAKVADAIAATENTVPDNAGLGEKLMASARGLVVRRPVGNVEGSTAGAIAARMEVAIANGDYGRALSEWEALSPQAQAVSADFISTLKARYAVDTLLSKLVSVSLVPGGQSN